MARSDVFMLLHDIGRCWATRHVVVKSAKTNDVHQYPSSSCVDIHPQVLLELRVLYSRRSIWLQFHSLWFARVTVRVAAWTMCLSLCTIRHGRRGLLPIANWKLKVVWRLDFIYYILYLYTFHFILYRMHVFIRCLLFTCKHLIFFVSSRINYMTMTISTLLPAIRHFVRITVCTAIAKLFIA